MTTQVRCPHCGAVVQVVPLADDSIQKCPHCQGQFTVQGTGRSGPHGPMRPSETVLPPGSPVQPGTLVAGQTHAAQETKKATWALILGGLGMVAWCLPIIGLPVNMAGLILGLTSLRAPNRMAAVAGVVLSSIGLVLTIVNMILGAILFLHRHG